jgi:NADP-dependent 3-hydroxy acid dehydrogenase YdfG
VIATARKADAIADLSDLGVARRVELDVTSDSSVRSARESVGDIDVLVNNAGDIAFGELESIPFNEIRNLYELNVFGTLRMIQAFTPAMRERRSGTIVNMSSVLGKVAFPLNGIYSSTKWAVEGFSESLRFELSRFGVRVVLIEPGAVNSGSLDNPRSHVRADGPYAALTPRPDKAHMSTPEAVADTVATAIETASSQFRWIVGAETEALLGARKKLDDEAFDKVLRGVLKRDW